MNGTCRSTQGRYIKAGPDRNDRNKIDKIKSKYEIPRAPPNSCFYIGNAVDTEQPNGTVKEQNIKLQGGVNSPR